MYVYSDLLKNSADVFSGSGSANRYKDPDQDSWDTIMLP